MTDKQEREAHALVGFITGAVDYPEAAKLVRKQVLAAANKLIPKLDGTVKNELTIARANLKAL
jgi:hypothetical protein